MSSMLRAEDAPRVALGFEKAEEIEALAKAAENAAAEASADKGVTEGKQSLKVAFKQNTQWSSLALSGECLKGWDGAEAVALDVFTENAEGAELSFELQDSQSRDYATRCTLPAVKLAKGAQTLTWKLTHLRRNGKESGDWESLAPADKLALRDLVKVKIFTTPPKDRDLVVWFDNLRLTPKSPEALAAEKKESEANSAAEQVAYSANFENGKGLGGEGVPFKGNWLPLDKNVLPELAAPLGKGNDSKLALTVKAAKQAGAVCMELPLHGTVVEPEGWDGVVSLRIYNGGFKAFQMSYSPVIPSDITFHRVDFDAPKGAWTAIEIPLDKFLYHGRRPRRGCPQEYLCLIGMGPEADGSVFQFDDVKVKRVKRAGLPAAEPKAALPEGVAYAQSFDDAADFDLESFYPATRNANVFRVAGGLDADGKPVPAAKEGAAAPERGALELPCYEKNQEFSGGRSLSFAGEGHVIEFDCLLEGVTDFAVVVRGAKGRWRQYPTPEAGKWVRVTVSAEEFAPFGTAPKDGIEKKLSKAERFGGLFFSATADGSGASRVLIDNLTVKRVEPQPTKKE
ncbi:MAG: hypothetical protein HY291_22245 [Planctomycetes bacterium]|nr:hypothetical protein [Planctomycetota bacterium]